MNEEIIYLDHAATTPVDRSVLDAALPYFTTDFYNPASAHVLGQKAAAAVERARIECAAAICAKPSEICFTSSGTEAVNLAVRGSFARRQGRNKVVVSGLEHDSVIESAEALRKLGAELVYVMPNNDGIITPSALERAVDENTALVCVMTVSNIVGTIQPIKELCALAHGHGALFFTDAVQAVNSLDISVADSCVDILAVSGHKIYAPKGSGFLYVRSGIAIEPLIAGGNQERGMRAGTVDVPSVVALGKAITAAAARRDEYNAHAETVANAFIESLEFGKVIAGNSPKTHDIISVAFDGVDGGRLAVALSMRGVCCSVGSACSAGAATPPPALVNMGLDTAKNSVRFSFGRHTTPEQAVRAAKTINDVVKRLSGK